MPDVDFFDELGNIAESKDFAAESYALSERWISLDVGVEAVEPIFRFMEAHPNIDFGSPGPLVHFVERFFGSGYEEKLLDSLARKPTQHTVWMMNRLINGVDKAGLRHRYIVVLRRARLHPDADWDARKQIDHFLERLSA
jgi:hypothetical protein